LLKSSRRYNRTRNRSFGCVDATDDLRNWAWTETWIHPISNASVERAQFHNDVFVLALYAALSQHEEAVCRLQLSWARGSCLVTDEMRLAHEHPPVHRKIRTCLSDGGCVSLSLSCAVPSLATDPRDSNGLLHLVDNCGRPAPLWHGSLLSSAP
jgi:hypothetical protein